MSSNYCHLRTITDVWLTEWWVLSDVDMNDEREMSNKRAKYDFPTSPPSPQPLLPDGAAKATQELESTLYKAWSLQLQIGQEMPSPVVHDLLIRLTDYYDITLPPAVNTSELDTMKQEVASIKSMITNLTTTARPLPDIPDTTNTTTKMPSGPKMSFATGPTIRPKNTHTKMNPTQQNHPSRLVLEIADAPDVSQRPTPLAARDKINAILQSSADTKDLRIVGVKFNAKGNCVAIAHPDTPVERLVMHINKFAKIVAGNSSVNAHPDTKWAHVVLNRVDTGQSYAGRIWTCKELDKEFKRALASEGITSMIGQPRWMAHMEVLKTKHHTSVVITLQSQEDADRLSKEIGGLIVFGDFTRAGWYTDKRPLKQCKLCWKYDHYQQTCTLKNVVCRLCSGPHPERAHKCRQCDKRDCQHLLFKCTNCDEAHPSDYTHCNARWIAIGSERIGPHAVTGGRRKPPKEQTVKENDGMELWIPPCRSLCPRFHIPPTPSRSPSDNQTHSINTVNFLSHVTFSPPPSHTHHAFHAISIKSTLYSCNSHFRPIA